jgi:hypothetical protein
MPDLSSKARHLVQLLAEELDRTGEPWSVLMFGDGARGSQAWDWGVTVGCPVDEVHWDSNADTNRADVIPIRRLK